MSFEGSLVGKRSTTAARNQTGSWLGDDNSFSLVIQAFHDICSMININVLVESRTFFGGKGTIFTV